MKTYTGCIESEIRYLLKDAFESVVGHDKAVDIVDGLNDRIHISVSLREISMVIYCDAFTAEFLARKLSFEGFNAKEYEKDIERIELIKKI
jgi:hypothetical protein